MPRYAVFLRGVSPMNLKMPALSAALEDAGFSDVKTVLASGNAVFSARKAPEASLQRKAEAAIEAATGKPFMAFVRSIEHLQGLLDADPYAKFKLPANAKRIVTFLHDAPTGLPKLPHEVDGAHLLALHRHELFSAYVPKHNDPLFMRLIDKHCGKAQTTRTWETIRKVCSAGAA